MKLPVNKSLRQIARNMRNNATLGEVLLWKHLKSRRANGLDFDRQKVIGNYIVDFYCAKLKLVIEVDGSSHDNKFEYDFARDDYLRGLGLYVIHINDADVRFKMNAVLGDIETVILNLQQ